MHATGSVSSRSEYRSSSSLFRKDKRADTRCSNNLHDLGRYVHMGGLGLQLLCWKRGGSCTDQQKAGRHPMPMPQRRDTGLAARPPPESRTNAPNQDAVVYRYTGEQVRQQVGHLDYPCLENIPVSDCSQLAAFRSQVPIGLQPTWLLRRLGRS